MATRREFFASAGLLAAAPRPAGYQGRFVPGRLSARYFARERQTWILFETNSVLRAGYFDHDSATWSQPREARGREPFPSLPAPTGPELLLNEKNPGLRLVAKEGRLTLWERRSAVNPWVERRVLFPYPPEAEIVLVQPVPHHADVVALWSCAGELYYTNRDLIRVYQLPTAFRETMERPRLVPLAG